jgi:hypothetical protein
MKFNAILRQFEAALKSHYAGRLLPSMFQAINALLRCRTEAAGAIKLRCEGCDETSFQPRSCVHRSCCQCQNHETSKWLDRQFAKLLPVEYFMVTFTLPYELRHLARCNQTAVYNILFDCAASTLKDFGLNPANLGADIGMTAVLHTHSRRLDYHPHCHVIVPSGGIDKRRRQWKKVKGKLSLMSLLWLKCFVRAVWRLLIKRASRSLWGFPKSGWLTVLMSGAVNPH